MGFRINFLKSKMHVHVHVSRIALLALLMVSVLKEADKGPLGSGRKVLALSHLTISYQ